MRPSKRTRNKADVLLFFWYSFYIRPIIVTCSGDVFDGTIWYWWLKQIVQFFYRLDIWFYGPHHLFYLLY
ncbi:hypothetical protein Hdeb2414_s0010g00350241 [Helianthus debilis subsp. tardiflorus]